MGNGNQPTAVGGIIQATRQLSSGQQEMNFTAVRRGGNQAAHARCELGLGRGHSVFQSGKTCSALMLLKQT